MEVHVELRVVDQSVYIGVVFRTVLVLYSMLLYPVALPLYSLSNLCASGDAG